MADQDNKLSIIFSGKDEQFVIFIKEHFKSLEANSAISFWPQDFPIEKYSSNLQQVKQQLASSELFIILWSPELADHVEKDANADEIKPFQVYVRPLLQQNATPKDSIFTIIVRDLNGDIPGINYSVLIPKLKIPLTTYSSPKKVLELELSIIENVIYRRLLVQRISLLPKDRDKFLEDNLHRLANQLISTNSNLPKAILQQLLYGEVDQLLQTIKNKKLDEELSGIIEREEQEHQKQIDQENFKKEYTSLSIFQAKLLSLKGQYTEAEKKYQQAHQLEPRNLEILEEWSALLKKKGDWNEASKIDLKIDNATAYLEQDGVIAHSNGNFFFNNLEFKEAEEWLIKALGIRKTLADKFPLKYILDCGYTYLQLGVLYSSWGKFGEARDNLHEALVLRKSILEQKLMEDENTALRDYAITLHWLGQLYSMPENPERNLAQATTYYEEAIEVRKNKLSKEDDINIEEIGKLMSVGAELYRKTGNNTKAQEWEDEAHWYNAKSVWRDQKLSKRVFISYSSKDETTVKKLQESLRGYGIDAIIDSVDMRAGESIRSFIERSIRETHFTLSVVSKNSLLSAWVTLETIEALYEEEKLGKEKFIPCYIDSSFKELNFPDQAWEIIENDLAEIKDLIQKRQAANRPYNELQDRRVLLENLHSQLTNIIQRLRNVGCVNLTESNFKEGMQKIADTILISKSFLP